MKVIIVSLLIFFSFMACDSAEDTAQNSVNSALEKVIESQTGQEMDLADVGSFENNKVKASFTLNGEEQITGKTNMVGTILGATDANGKLLSFQFQDEEGVMITVVVSLFPDNFSLPFTTKMYQQDKAPKDTPSAVVSFMKASENGMFSYISYDGTLTIHELNAKKASLTINGKAGDGINWDKPTNWKDLKADFTITSPIVQTMGFDKNEILK